MAGMLFSTLWSGNPIGPAAQMQLLVKHVQGAEVLGRGGCAFVCCMHISSPRTPQTDVWEVYVSVHV